MPYAHTTWSQARTDLAEILQDRDKIFWTDSELSAYLTEALQVWGSLTGYWRNRDSFVTSSGTAFYHLPTQISALAYSVTDLVLFNRIATHLLEPSGWPYSGSIQMTGAAILGALTDALNRVLTETHLVLTRRTAQALMAPPIRSFSLADTVVAVRRAVYTNVSGTKKELSYADESEAAAFDADWSTTAKTAGSFMKVASDPLTMRFAPIISDIGTLDTMTVETHAALDPASPVTVNFPDDLTWVIKWLALADLLLREGEIRSPLQAMFAKGLSDFGLLSAREYTHVLYGEINGRSVPVVTLEELDQYSPNWEGNSPAPPTALAVSGDWLVAHPVPDGVYSVTLDVVEPAPVPASDSAQIQMGLEDLEAVLDYGAFLAAFKQGGTEMVTAFPKAMNLLEAALSYGNRIRGHHLKALSGLVDVSRRLAGFNGPGLVEVPEMKAVQSA